MVALIASTGTKALLLASDSRLIREVNRSYYQAGVYRYPLTLCTLPDSQTGLVHCPRTTTTWRSMSPRPANASPPAPTANPKTSSTHDWRSPPTADICSIPAGSGTPWDASRSTT
ncbi:hypothetical protein H4W33_007231 [Kibdelosporangium phytohabitans]|nr:hypothetical protein [Kibdelosporangium phytohabitans]